MGASTRRPAAVEWPDRLAGVPHGTWLLCSGRHQGALQDASLWSSPDTVKPKYVHIAVASRRLGMSPGNIIAEAAACGPARIMLFTDGSCKDAAAFPDGVRCRRPACAALFEEGDRQEARPASGRPCRACQPLARRPSRRGALAGAHPGGGANSIRGSRSSAPGVGSERSDASVMRIAGPPCGGPVGGARLVLWSRE